MDVGEPPFMIMGDVLVIASSADEAGLNIAKSLLDLINFKKIDITPDPSWLLGTYEGRFSLIRYQF